MAHGLPLTQKAAKAKAPQKAQMTELLRSDILYVLQDAGWRINDTTKFRTFTLFKDKYCLPTRKWVEQDAGPLWQAEAQRLGLVMNSPKYNCVDIGNEVVAWVRRSDAVNDNVTLPRLWGCTLFKLRNGVDHCVNWTIVNDGGPEPRDYQLSLISGFDPQLCDVYPQDRDETNSIFTAFA